MGALPGRGDKPKNWAAFNAPPVLLAPTSELVPMDPQPYQPPQPPRPPTPPTPPYPSGAPEPQMPLPPEQLVQRLEPLAQPQHPQFQLAGDTIVYYPPQPPPMTGQLVPAPPHRPELTERAVQKQLERYRKQLERRRASEAADGCAGCEKNPLCTRGYRHGGLGGSCSTKPPRKKPYSAASIAAATALKPYSATNLAAIARENTQAMVDVVLSAAKEAKEGAKLAAAKEAKEGEAKLAAAKEAKEGKRSRQRSSRPRSGRGIHFQFDRSRWSSWMRRSRRLSRARRASRARWPRGGPPRCPPREGL